MDEIEIYETSGRFHDIPLPLTREGFEILLAIASKLDCEIPVDDNQRSVMAGFIHHLDRECHLTTIDKLSRVLHKSWANFISWQIDQEAKERRQTQHKLTLVTSNEKPTETTSTEPV